MNHVLAITTGEPAGIGPEISLVASWQMRRACVPLLIGDFNHLLALAGQIDPAMRLVRINPAHPLSSLRSQPLTVDQPLHVLDTALAAAVRPGHCDPANAGTVLATLDQAIELTMGGQADAIVTAPVQKSVINQAGIGFSGHTEYLAQKTGVEEVVMMLACARPNGLSRPLRVALVTTHLPLRAVADAITQPRLNRIITILHEELRDKFGLAAPQILVAGLNPHAGENGYLGREEIDVIEPVLKSVRAAGIDARGPYPADTLFQAKYLDQADCVLAMYHDQGLPVLKHASFGKGVNITLGLPLIRTSVDHGTALDIAASGLGLADPGSMLEAIQTALDMAAGRRQSAQARQEP